MTLEQFQKRHALKAITLITASALLTGCAATNHSNDFNCGAVTGTPCQSIAVADGGSNQSTRQLVVPKNGNTTKSYDPEPRNKFRDLFFGNKLNTGLSNPEWPTNAENAKLGIAGSRNLPSSRYKPELQRIEERLGTLWVASYLDGDNVLHDASYVHFVINNARWAGVTR